ncbi:hypothetical protein [Halorubellus litoreus]|uniref:HEAT repeat-containing protein n=1 Tax=Halorubellus litoreus TaxID=755308 RepID=A0ABD5VLC1_9EURY
MTDESRSLPDVDAVVDVLTTALPTDPTPSEVRTHRRACKDARRLLDADPTLARSLAVPLATTLRDDLVHRDVAGASAMFGIGLYAREAATAAARALEAIPVWRLVDTDALEPFVAAIATVAAATGQDRGRVAAATALERASVYAPTAVATVLDDTGLGDDLIDAVTPLPDPTALDSTTARLIVALVHTDRTAALPDIGALIESGYDESDDRDDPAVTTRLDPAVATRLAVLDATTSTARPRESNASDEVDGPIARLRELAPGLSEDAGALDSDAGTADAPVDPKQTDASVDDASADDALSDDTQTGDALSDDTQTGDDDAPSVTPPHRPGSLINDDDDDTPRTATSEDDESEKGTISFFDEEEPTDAGDASDSRLDVETVVEPLALVVASDRASTATRSDAFDALLAATDETTRGAFHELGVLTALDALSPPARNRLRETVVEHLEAAHFFGARATRGRRVAFMEHHDVRPAALAAPDERAPVTPLVLETDLLTTGEYERVAETLIDAISHDSVSVDERRTLGWLHVHGSLPEPLLARLRSTLTERLDGDEDDRDWALETVTGLAGYGILDTDTATDVLDATIGVVTATPVADVPGNAGRAVSALLTASELTDAHVTRLVDRLPDLLQADAVPPARTGARVLAALAATERLPSDLVADVLGVTVQLCTVDVGFAERVSLRVAAVHALQGLATNYHIPREYREHVLGALSIVARGDERRVDQSRRAALESYRVITDEMPLPEFDADIVLPVLETALVQLLPGERFEEPSRDGTGPGPQHSRFTTRAAETLRDVVDTGLIDAELFAGVLSTEAADATWLKNYPPAVVRMNQAPQLGRFLAPDNPAVPPLLAAVATATTQHPDAFTDVRPTLERFLARTDPNPETTASVLDVISRLPAPNATASTIRR